MKKLLLFLIVAGLLSFGAGQALARPAAHKATTVTVVMHDPGCHWFSVGGKFLTKYSVAGPVKLVNYDENTLIVKGPAGTVNAKIGKPVELTQGTYKITMVKQASDDNHLVLVVK